MACFHTVDAPLLDVGDMFVVAMDTGKSGSCSQDLLERIEVDEGSWVGVDDSLYWEYFVQDEHLSSAYANDDLDF